MISLIIPTYITDLPSAKMTTDCLDSLRYDTRPDEVIVVDDASPKQIFIQDKHIRLPENKGFAGAVNEGLRAATGDILIISNNDIIFQPGWLSGLVDPLKEADICSIRTTDNSGWETEDKLTEGDKFGSIWAMKRSVYELLGGLDESLGKSTFEDLDYRRRAREAGLRIVKNHNALVEHLGRATMSKIYKDNEDFIAGREAYLKKWGNLE